MPYITDLQAQRGMRALSAVPQEIRAVKDYSPLISGLAQSDAQRYAEGVNRDTERERMNAIMEDARRDRRMAARDAKVALPLTIAATGLGALGAYQTRKEADVERQRKQEEGDYWAAMGEMSKRYFQTIIDMLTNEPRPSYNTGMQPITPVMGGD